MSARKRVLAVASAGGHWVQLFRLRPAFEGCDVTWVTTDAGRRDEILADAAARGLPAPGFVLVAEANRWTKLKLVQQLLQIAWAVLRVRPHAVITTGAAPGYFAIRFAKLLGAKAVWIDSIANADELSLSGKQVGPHADLWLTQWPHLAGAEGARGPAYRGAVV